jgi:chitin synthase
MIVFTMYNEDEILFARTLRGVLANIADLTAREGDGPWGKGCWKKIVVCIVSDGRGKLNPRTKALLTLLGVYQDGVAKGTISGKDVMAHVYEVRSLKCLSALFSFTMD